MTLQHQRRFRFGVSVSSASSGEELRAKARRAEELGFATFLVSDHLLESLSPFSALGFAADATASIHVGTLVLNNDFRHPALVAREAATLQHLSNGRFELGLGAGHAEAENRSIGLPFEDASIRLDRLEESLKVMSRLSAGDAVTFEGNHYSLHNQILYPTPSVAIPVLIGGNGERLLRLAGRYSDIVGFTGFFPRAGSASHLTHFSDEGLASRVAVVRHAAGDRFDGLELNCLVQGVTVTSDIDSAVSAIVARVPGANAADLVDCPFYFAGEIARMVDALQRRRETLGVSYYAVFEKDMEALAPIVARLSGR